MLKINRGILPSSRELAGMTSSKATQTAEIVEAFVLSITLIDCIMMLQDAALSLTVLGDTETAESCRTLADKSEKLLMSVLRSTGEQE